MSLFFDIGYLSLIGVFSLLIGSFLNVVIIRLPLIIENQLKKDCALILNQNLHSVDVSPLTLSFPSSHCPHCLSLLRWRDNIPLFSYFWLKGKCYTCKNSISKRYPIIEFITVLCSIITAYFIQQGLLILMLSLLLTWSLIVLVVIDYEHLILPDNITLPLLWLGLIANAFNIFCSPTQAIMGAFIGYFSLWSVFWIFKIITGKEGMGYGDFKLLALFGAWLGIEKIPLLLLIASLTASVCGIIYLKVTRRSTNTLLPFGPYLALGGWIMLLWGTPLNRVYWPSIFLVTMLRIGLTGGIGSGKSTVSDLFQQFEVPVISCDKITHQLLTTPFIKQQIVAHFGSHVLKKEEIDKFLLRQLIFDNNCHKIWLEKLLHPLIKKEIEKQILLLKYPYVIIEIPLLIEAAWQDMVDRVLVVETLLEQQKKRIRERSTLNEDSIEKIIYSQATPQQRRKIADDIIINNSTLLNLQKNVNLLHQKYLWLAL